MFFKAVNCITSLLKHTASVSLFFGLMVLTFADVLGRYVFNAPIMGVFELTEFMLVIAVFFSLSHTQSVKGHVTVDFLVNRLPGKWRDAIDLFNNLISFSVFTIISIKSAEAGMETMAAGQHSGTLLIPVYPFVFMVAVGSAAMGLELLKDFIIKAMEIWRS